MQRSTFSFAVVFVILVFCIAAPTFGSGPANIPKKSPAVKANNKSTQIFSIINKLDFSDLLGEKTELGPDELKELHPQLISGTGTAAENVTVLHLQKRAAVIQADVPPGFTPSVLYLTRRGNLPYVKVIPEQGLADEGKPSVLPMTANRSLLMMKDPATSGWKVDGLGPCKYDEPKLEGLTGLAVNEKDESVLVRARFQSAATAVIEFNAPPSFKPKYVTLICNDRPATFFYQPPRPLLQQSMQFENPDMGKLCDIPDNDLVSTASASTASNNSASQASNSQPPNTQTGGVAADSKPSATKGNETKPPEPKSKALKRRNCAGTNFTNFAVTFYPVLTTGDMTPPKVTAIRDGIAFIEFSAPEDYKPEVANITNKKESVLARSIPAWRSSPNLFNMSYSVMDPETVRRAFGNRIAKRYFVVDLHLRNPGLRKVQIRKSAMWFDVDYARASDKKIKLLIFTRDPDHKRDPLYRKPSEADKERGDNLSVFTTSYLHGIDQNMQQHPLSHSDVLNSYDEEGFLENKRFGFVDLGTSLLSGVAAAFGGQTLQTVGNMLSSTVLPKVKNIFMNDEREKRHRSNLVERTFQDVVQVSPRNSQDTAVLLPRYVVLGSNDRRVITSLRDVHVDLEVVTDVLDESIAKGELKAGMTESQVVQSLGVPDKRDENASAINYTYAHGLYKTVTFSHEGRTVSWDRRLTPEQGMLLTDLQGLLNPIPGTAFPPNFPSHKRILWDGSEVWPNVGTPAQNLRILNGVVAELNFHSAESEIAALKGKSDKEVRDQLESWAKAQGDKAVAKVEVSISLKENPFKSGGMTYDSPFASNEKIRVSYDQKSKAVTTAEIINN